MLGAPCSPCCGDGCTQAKADELNAALKQMSVEVTLSQSGYVPQSGFFRSNTAAAIFAVEWNIPFDTVPSLDRCRTLIDSSGHAASFNYPGELFAPEQQVNASPYLLALDASETLPVFTYLDSHISIYLRCYYSSTGGVSPGFPMQSDTSQCNFRWNLRVFKLRRYGNVSLANAIELPVQETTYGPANVNSIIGAAVAQYRPYGYAVRDAQQLDTAYPFRSAFSFSQSYYHVLSIDSHASYSQTQHPIVRNSNGFEGTGSASKQQDGSITIACNSNAFQNGSWSFLDRTTEDTDLQPRLVENPSYSLTRLSLFQGDDRIRMLQTYSQISTKTVQYVSTPFTASTVVSLTPP